ncbi:MAG: hypothetical protein MPJ50_13475 [Pirellulales bacterium]|nr:hypothetical protein [Pirellulales bacterium]
MFLAQQNSEASTTIIEWLMTFPFWVWIALGGMLMSTIFGVMQMIIKHRERIEQIRQGHALPPDNDD